MLGQYVVAALVLVLTLGVLAGPSVIAAYRWRYGGGKLLHDRLGPKPPTRRRQS